MATPEELMLQDLFSKYRGIEVDSSYTRLYPGQGATSRMFANFHERLNSLFVFMNAKARSNRHFNADGSRELIGLIDEIEDARTILKRVGVKFDVGEYYRQIIRTCKPFLMETNGSTIPDDFERINIVKYEPVFLTPDMEIQLPNRWESAQLEMVGEGAFATVYRYTDPEYGMPFALKRAKPRLDERDLTRFRREFQLLRRLRFPYVLEVYRYNDDLNEYTMEYCDATLAEYITHNNKKLSFAIRKRIGLQFLYGLYYLHTKGHLHRDLSYKNVLVKRYDGLAVMVKLSDFGLAKEHQSDLTRTESKLRGTILDPTLRSFRDYGLINEIYVVGFILSFIFSGRTDITACTGVVRPIIDKCVAYDHAARYPDVRSIIRDVERLATDTAETRAETPA
jgi:tRNA A-37 threonylcarbamoyl transferase component Bud32